MSLASSQPRAGLECKEILDTFGLKFAANQWLKLVANAEGLFSRLLSNKVLPHHDAEQVEEWLFLKQECEECLSTGENITKQLSSIIEEQPQNCFDSAGGFLDVEERCKSFNENGYYNKFPGEVLERSDSLSDMEALEQSDTDSHKTVELEHGIENLIKNFRIMTDTLTKDRFEHFTLIQPKSVFNSIDTSKSLAKASVNSEPLCTRARRRSINPGQSLSSIELQVLRRAASSGSAVQAPSSDLDLKEPTINDLELLKIKCSNAVSELESIYKQMKAIKETISLKTQLLTELMKNNDTRVHAKQKFTKKKSRLEYDLANARKNLVQATNYASSHNNAESHAGIEKWKILADHYEHRLKDICDISGFTGDGKQQLEKLQCSLEGLKTQLDALHIQSKEVKKLKINLEKDIKKKKKNEQIKKSEKNSLKDVTSRISHLDQVLKQKSLHLLHTADTAEQKSVRTEIRNLRKTRDHLQVQRTRLKGLKSPDMQQQRRLLEWDEAIEAIDTAIEVKNERICGRTSILDSNSKRHDEGERMLTARLNKLTLTETRTLLYKYFQKVIDLKDSGRKMEKQLLRLEAQQESWKHALNDAVKEAILKGERNVVYLQHQHQQRLNVLLRHLTDETSASLNERNGLVARHTPYELTTYEAQSSNTKMKQPYCKELGLYTERPFDKGLKEPKNKFFTRLLQTSTGPTTKVTREKNKLIIQQNNR